MYADINKLFSAFNLRITANRLACGHLQADKEGKEKTDEKVDEEERRGSEEMMGRAARPIWSKINRLLSVTFLMVTNNARPGGNRYETECSTKED